MPAHLLPIRRESQEPLDAIPVLGWWVRGALLAMAAGLVTVFVIGFCLNPYDDNGRPMFSETHLKLGLPPCQFRALTGVPCPSCGMTTSFTWLMHGDLRNSLRANAVGTVLAVFCLALIPWSLACALRGRPFFVVSFDRAVTWVVIIFLVLLLTRWFIVLGLSWWNGWHF